MEPEPLISVLMPCYDRPYLMAQRSIPSVLAQTYRNWELVVVSDGLDNHPVRAAVEGFGDERIRYAEIPRPDYSGLDPLRRWYVAGAAARNRAEELARGEIMALLDDDDAFLPGHLADCARMLVESGADLCYGLVRLYDGNLGSSTDYYLPWGEPGTLQAFRTENVLYTPSVAYRSRWKRPPYPTDGVRAADHGKWLAMYAAGAEFVGTATPQAVYYGDRSDGVLRLATASLPPAEELGAPVRNMVRDRELAGPGRYSAQLEAALAEYVGAPQVVAVSSPEAGLDTALRVARTSGATGVVGGQGQPWPRGAPGHGAEVVLPGYAPPATAEAVVRAGCTPVFCDVQSGSLTMTAETAERAITARTVALLAVHPHGIPPDVCGLRHLASAHGLLTIQDATHALGSSVAGGRTGSGGELTVFGFGPGAPLTAGEGGAVSCRDPEQAAELRRYVQHGTGADGVDGADSAAGGRCALPEFPAAVALRGLPRLDAWLAERAERVALYRELLADVPELPLVQPESAAIRPSWAAVALLAPSAAVADRLRDRLAAYRVECGRGLRPPHRMARYAHCAPGPLPVVESAAERVIRVPLSAVLPRDSVRLVAGVLRHELRRLRGGGQGA